MLLCDSDLFFIRSIPANYLSGRTVPAATPSIAMISGSAYAHFNLSAPSFKVLCGGALFALVQCRNGGCPQRRRAQCRGRICLAINGLDWVPERWPYLDQIALPLAMSFPITAHRGRGSTAGSTRTVPLDG